MTAPLLHVGRVDHVRHAPFVHCFHYRIWMLSADIDDMPASSLLGHDRTALVSLRTRDHGARNGSPWRPWVEARLAGAGLQGCAASIRLMCIPRVAGFAFNPIAFFFCHDAQGRLGAVIHQVRNTFGDHTSYVLPVTTERGAPIAQDTGKRMHVSPFFDMRGGYRFAFDAPDFTDAGGRIHLAIRYGADGQPRLTASMALANRRLTTAGLLKLLAVMPLMPVKVVAAIHWQALLLWLRGARFHPVPKFQPGEHA